jgi:hypothetical protein
MDSVIEKLTQNHNDPYISRARLYQNFSLYVTELKQIPTQIQSQFIQNEMNPIRQLVWLFDQVDDILHLNHIKVGTVTEPKVVDDLNELIDHIIAKFDIVFSDEKYNFGTYQLNLKVFYNTKMMIELQRLTQLYPRLHQYLVQLFDRVKVQISGHPGGFSQFPKCIYEFILQHPACWHHRGEVQNVLDLLGFEVDDSTSTTNKSSQCNLACLRVKQQLLLRQAVKCGHEVYGIMTTFENYTILNDKYPSKPFNQIYKQYLCIIHQEYNILIHTGQKLPDTTVPIIEYLCAGLNAQSR